MKPINLEKPSRPRKPQKARKYLKKYQVSDYYPDEWLNISCA